MLMKIICFIKGENIFHVLYLVFKDVCKKYSENKGIFCELKWP